MDRMFRSSTDALVTLDELKEQRISLHMIASPSPSACCWCGACAGSQRWRTLDKISRSRHIPGVTLLRVQPIVPIRRKEPFDHPDWLFDFKYDGFRCFFADCAVKKWPLRGSLRRPAR
jgi:hypothetical protein